MINVNSQWFLEISNWLLVFLDPEYPMKDSMAKTGMINPQLMSDFQAGKVDETQVKEKLLPFISLDEFELD